MVQTKPKSLKNSLNRRLALLVASSLAVIVLNACGPVLMPQSGDIPAVVSKMEQSATSTATTAPSNAQDTSAYNQRPNQGPDSWKPTNSFSDDATSIKADDLIDWGTASSQPVVWSTTASQIESGDSCWEDCPF